MNRNNKPIIVGDFQQIKYIIKLTHQGRSVRSTYSMLILTELVEYVHKVYNENDYALMKYAKAYSDTEGVW